MNASVRFAVLGLDHRHIYGMTQGMIDAGATPVGWWSEGDPQPLAGFAKRFPDLPRAASASDLLDDETVDLVLIACKPQDRAALAVKAMHRGKDVMADKPGCITPAELDDLRAAVRDSGRFWSVDFSERFEVAATTVATQLLRAGEIGDLVHMTGLGPHRLNAATRPDWFFDAATYGGILTDIGSHQIEQFLHFADLTEAEVVHSATGNFANPDHPRFEDFGEIVLRGGRAQAYIRLDWYTADALPNWGDGRLFLNGTKGTIELRKYVDVDGRPGTDHLFLVTNDRCEHIDCQGADLPYFRDIAHDVVHRTETACPQARTFTVCDLAMQAQAMAEKRT